MFHNIKAQNFMQLRLDISNPTSGHTFLASTRLQCSRTITINQTNIILVVVVSLLDRTIDNDTQLVRIVNHKRVVNFVVTLLKRHRDFNTVHIGERLGNSSSKSYSADIVAFHLVGVLQGVQGLELRTRFTLIIHHITKRLREVGSGMVRIQFSQYTKVLSTSHCVTLEAFYLLIQ